MKWPHASPSLRLLLLLLWSATIDHVAAFIPSSWPDVQLRVTPSAISTTRAAAAGAAGEVEPPAFPSQLTRQELWEMNQYFLRAGHDNNTDFFVASRQYEDAIQAMMDEMHLTKERATMIHKLGACYVWVRDKFRRTHDARAPTEIQAGSTFRLYLRPRAYPACYVDDYAARVVYEDDDLVVLDKPEGCPCAPHLSNNLDCLDVVFSASTDRAPLIRMNRLDTCTAGLVALAKHKAAATHFQGLIRDSKVTKLYRALLLGPVPLGRVHHYMPAGIFHGHPAPRVISRVAHKGWKTCLCEVRSCEPLYLPHLPPGAHEVEVELITGRTHQLRAQFAALGSPIHGDDMYIPMRGFRLDDLDDRAVHDLYGKCVEPVGRVALQCYRLDFDGRSVSIATPWWRDREVVPPATDETPSPRAGDQGDDDGSANSWRQGDRFMRWSRVLGLSGVSSRDGGHFGVDVPWLLPPPPRDGP